MFRLARNNNTMLGPLVPDETEWALRLLSLPRNQTLLGIKVLALDNPPAATLQQTLTTSFDGRVDDNEPLDARIHVFRETDNDDKPFGVLVEFGWDDPLDRVREIDVALEDDRESTLKSALTVFVLLLSYMFENDLADRIRWRWKHHPENGPGWLQSLGATTVYRRELTTGYESVFELSRSIYDAFSVSQTGPEIIAPSHQTLMKAMRRFRGRS